MSVIDQLRDIENQIVGRLRELEPVVREYEELRAAAGRLGIEYDPSSSVDGDRRTRRRRSATARTDVGKRVSGSRSSGTAAGRAKRGTGSAKSTGAAGRSARRRPAAAGQREEQMLALVRENPGTTVAEIAQRLDVDATGLYRVLRRLAENGQVRKDGARLYPRNEATAPRATGSGGESKPADAAKPR